MKNEDQLKQNTLELGVDVADIAIDMLTENELLKDLPVVGLIYKSIKTLISIPDKIFLYKAAKFFQAVNQKTTKQQRLDFTEELKKDSNKREKLYIAILIKL
ncbi:hypothetical protein [Trichocoleus sp. FACHB-262]|uniref:hypothetical protein n=1 Tax=Trichocoleus sp. FACHB-262 TaxID=2692869 RepID=UPI0016888A0B|nr:hypothetical protein [Trichocoleus sp. FACHB-262]MBD2124228.1 hypothetical protein [Trichocoleus sp. FACHB-262]